VPTPDLLSSPARVRALPGGAGLDDDRVYTLLVKASAAFRGQTRQHISAVAGDVVTLDARPSWALQLPQVPVTAVHAVVVDGLALVEGDDFEWSAAGVLKRHGRWPDRYRSVVVTYDHGYPVVPDDVADVVAEAAVIGSFRTPGVLNVQLGATSYGFDRSGRTQDWVDTVARYRVRRR